MLTPVCRTAAIQARQRRVVPGDPHGLDHLREAHVALQRAAADTLDAKLFAATWRPKLAAERGRLRTAAEEERDLQQSLERLGRYLGLVALIFWISMA